MHHTNTTWADRLLDLCRDESTRSRLAEDFEAVKSAVEVRDFYDAVKIAEKRAAEAQRTQSLSDSLTDEQRERIAARRAAK
jgi:hypothetical protein